MSSRLAAALLLTVTCAALLSGCGGTPTSTQGRQACSDVSKSISLYNESLHAASPAVAAALGKQATAELRLALPLAAEAETNNGTWQPLEATLSESNRFGTGASLNEGELTTALRAQCAADLGN